MRPRIVPQAMLSDIPPDIPMTFVASDTQANVHVFIPESSSQELVRTVAENFSRRVQQPVKVFHDQTRQKFRLCPLPAESTVDTSNYGMFCFSCDESDPKSSENDSSSSDSQDDDDEHIPRPRNRWILYRQYQCSQLSQHYPGITASELSKLISTMWKNERESEKMFWNELAQTEERNHKEKYPNYKYTTKKSSKNKKKKKKESEPKAETS